MSEFMERMLKMKNIVVTRHPALVEFMTEIGLIQPDGDIEVLTHVTDPTVLHGARVFGVLPIQLAAEADTVVVIPLDLPAELRGKELGIEELRQFAGEPQEFQVRKVV